MSERPEDLETTTAAEASPSPSEGESQEVAESAAVSEVGPADGETSPASEGSPDRFEGRDEEEEPATPEQVAETGAEFLRGLLAAMELEAEVTATTEGDSAFLDVVGEGLGMLIGRRGQT